MLTRPILNKVPTFDANIQNTITFNVIGGSQVFGNNLIIERTRDSAEIYNESVTNFNLRHILPANSLINSEEYKAKIRTKDINNDWSLFSDFVIFKCYSKPIISIINIDYENQNRVYNQTVIFTSDYYQAESEPLQSYRYLLYDLNKNLIYSYKEQFPNDSGFLTQEITGLENDVLYYLEVITLSPNGNKGSSGLINFKPLYISPRLVASIEPRAVPELGAIKIESNITQVLLKLYDNEGNEIISNSNIYEDGEWINLNHSVYDKLVADRGFYILQENFVLQLWCKDLPEDKIFMTLYSPDGRTELLKRNGKILAYKRIDKSEIYGYFGSNDFIASDTDEIYLYMKQNQGLIDLRVETIFGQGGVLPS